MAVRDDVMARLHRSFIIEQRKTGRAGTGHAHQNGPGKFFQRRQHLANLRNKADRRRLQVITSFTPIGRVQRAAIHAVPAREDRPGWAGDQRVDEQNRRAGESAA